MSGDQVCAAGWEWGYLARHEVDGLDYYRLPGTEAGDGVDPQTYLSAADAEPLAVDLETVPYESLESLAQICDLRAAPKEGRADRGAASSLLARPNLVKMGHAPAATWHLPLTQWLRDNVPAFREALETVAQRWGRLVLHQGLLIARVEDLSLQVQLERAFAGSESVVFLPNGYLAFTPRITPEHFRSAFTTAQGWGTFEQKREGNSQTERIMIQWGKLWLKTLAFTPPNNWRSAKARLKAAGKPIDATCKLADGRVTVPLAHELTLNENEVLEIEFIQ